MENNKKYALIGHRTLIIKTRRASPTNCSTPSVVMMIGIILFIDDSISCFNNLDKKWGAESSGDSNAGHGVETRVTYQCAGALFVTKWTIVFLYTSIVTWPTMKNRCVIHLFLFDPELNFVISISSAYELQIGWFFSEFF